MASVDEARHRGEGRVGGSGSGAGAGGRFRWSAADLAPNAVIGLYGRAAARKPGLGGIDSDGGSTSKFNRWQAALIHSGRNPKVSAPPAGTGETIYSLKAKNKCFVIHARGAINVVAVENTHESSDLFFLPPNRKLFFRDVNAASSFKKSVIQILPHKISYTSRE